jgi:hypothetical protein
MSIAANVSAARLLRAAVGAEGAGVIETIVAASRASAARTRHGEAS